MPTFSIETDAFLGVSHYGDISAEGTGTVDLSDEQVQQLIDLIRENGGETDVEKLKLEEKYPDIYETLDDAYREVAYGAAYNHFVIEVYEYGDYDLSTDEIIENCEKYGFEFEYDLHDFLLDDDDTEIDEDALEEARSAALDEWIEEYRSNLDENEEALFLAEAFQIDIDIYAVNIDYDVEIPAEIIEASKTN